MLPDVWVDDKFLLKGTIVVINTWGMHMDPHQFSNPEVFNPDRYMEHKSLAPIYAVGSWEGRDHYGYGLRRRICPGIHLAERTMPLGIAKLLWAFNFEKGPGKSDGDPVTGYNQGFLYCAKNYAYQPVIRDEHRRERVEREFGVAQNEVFSKYKDG